MQLIVIAALGLLLFNYSLQAVADAVDKMAASLTVVGFAAVILAAVAALRHDQRDHPHDAGRTTASLLRAVTVAGTVLFSAALIGVVLLISPPLGAWVGFAAFTVTAMVMQTRTRSSWRLLLSLVVVAMVLSVSLAPTISEDSFPTAVYLFSGAAAIAVDTYGMVRLVQLEGVLLRTRRQAVTLAALRERSRVARDVHDLLGLGITTIVMKAELAARLLRTDPERARTHLAEARRLVQGAAEAAGAITGQAADATTSLTAEAGTAERALAEAGVAVRLSLAPVPQGPDAVLAVILREAVTNILRHASAANVRIALTTEGGRCRFEIENDGAGEPVRTAGTGRGLPNIGSRVAEAGGVVDVSHHDGRFQLTVTLPV